MDSDGATHGGNDPQKDLPNLAKELEQLMNNTEEDPVSEEEDTTEAETGEEEVDDTDDTEEESVEDSDEQEEEQPQPNARKRKPIKKSKEQLRQERADAIKKSLQNHQEAEQARADVEYYKTYAKVVEDPDSIVSIHKESPEVADRIAREKWGISYDQLISKARGDIQSGVVDPTQVESIIERKLQEKERQAEKQKLDNALVDFFVDNDIEVGSSTFKQIREEYASYNVQTVDQAKKILGMLHREYVGEDVQVKDIPSVSVPNVGGSKASLKRSKKNTRDSIMDLANALGAGISEEDVRKYI